MSARKKRLVFLPGGGVIGAWYDGAARTICVGGPYGLEAPARDAIRGWRGAKKVTSERRGNKFRLTAENCGPREWGVFRNALQRAGCELEPTKSFRRITY